MRVALLVVFCLALLAIFNLFILFLKSKKSNDNKNNRNKRDINIIGIITSVLIVLFSVGLYAVEEIASPVLQGIGEDLISEESTINGEDIAEEENTEKSTEENTSEATTEESTSESTAEESTVSEKETEDEESETEEASTEDEFIFPDSDTRRLSRSELEGKNEWECKIARNEIFARRGKIFDDPELQAYFESCSWYEGKNSQYEYSEYISEIEAYNVQLIREYEEEHGYNPELNVPE